MRYKVGDKVKIKENNMYSLNTFLESLDPPYVITIKEIDVSGPLCVFNIVEKESYYWVISDIEKLYSRSVPIRSRFEILDL